MIVKLLTEHHLEFLSLTEGCRGSSESTHVKMPHCWKSHALAHLRLYFALLKMINATFQTFLSDRIENIVLLHAG